MRPAQRPHLRDDVPRQRAATPPGLCRVCAPPRLAHEHAATHGARHRSTLDPHCDALQSGDADQAVQRPDPPPPAHVLPRQRAPATGHCLALSRPSARLEHVLRPHAAAALTGSFSSYGPQDSTSRRSLREADDIFGRTVPLGAWCVQVQESGVPSPPSNWPFIGLPAHIPPSRRLPKGCSHSRMCKVTVYEKFRLVGVPSLATHPVSREATRRLFLVLSHPTIQSLLRIRHLLSQ